MRPLTLFCFFLLLIACSGEDEETTSTPPVAPAWIVGYPQVAYGATSVDLNFKLDRSAEIFYVLTDRPMNYTPEELIQKAEYPDTSAIKSSGKIELIGGDQHNESVTLLEQHSEYHVYVVARNSSGNVLSDMSTSAFTTYVRQDTATFESLAEHRTVWYLVYRPEEMLKYPDSLYPVCFSFGDKNSIATDPDDINLIRDGSLAEYIYQFHEVPMMVISIQGTEMSWDLDLIWEAIEHVNTTYPVDQKKIYMTGYGEGAIATWNYASIHPLQIAAIVPVSGKGDIPNACNLADVDVWTFHNETDDIISSSNTKKMVNAISKCPPQKEVSEIYFPDAGHNCWKRVYNSGHADWHKSPGVEKFNIYNWMLSKSKI